MESSKTIIVQVVNLETRETTYVVGIGDDGNIMTTSEFVKGQVFTYPYAMLIANSLEKSNVLVNLIKIR